jgi:hypothetical protein
MSASKGYGQIPAGVNSDSGFEEHLDQVVYDDSLFSVREIYVAVVLAEGGAGLVGGGPPRFGLASGSSYETKRPESDESKSTNPGGF